MKFFKLYLTSFSNKKYAIFNVKFKYFFLQIILFASDIDVELSSLIHLGKPNEADQPKLIINISHMYPMDLVVKKFIIGTVQTGNVMPP